MTLNCLLQHASRIKHWFTPQILTMSPLFGGPPSLMHTKIVSKRKKAGFIKRKQANADFLTKNVCNYLNTGSYNIRSPLFSPQSSSLNWGQTSPMSEALVTEYMDKWGAQNCSLYFIHLSSNNLSCNIQGRQALNRKWQE